MKYAATMALSHNNVMIFYLDLGEFDTQDEAKAVIEKHKETIDICDYHMEAEYNVLEFKDDNDGNPTPVFSLTVTEEEQNKLDILFCYANNENNSADVADVFGIEDDQELANLLSDFQDEYNQHCSEPSEWQQVLEKYRDKINLLNE